MAENHWLPPPLDALGRILRAHPRFEKELNQAAAPFENLGKTLLFSCNMCGNCVLHHTGLTCPMNCPKQIRNGPCGGVRMNGHCEVRPEMECVWLKAERRSRRLPWRASFNKYRYPIDWRLKGTSGILNEIVGRPEHDGKGGP